MLSCPSTYRPVSSWNCRSCCVKRFKILLLRIINICMPSMDLLYTYKKNNTVNMICYYLNVIYSIMCLSHRQRNEVQFLLNPPQGVILLQGIECEPCSDTNSIFSLPTDESPSNVMIKCDMTSNIC